MDERLSDKRPQFLMVIGTLSVINAVYGMISGVINAIAPPAVDDRTLENFFSRLEGFSIPFEAFRDDLEVYFLNTLLQMQNIAAASFLFYGLSLFGVLMMLRLTRNGFFLYAIAQVGLAVVPAFFGGFNAFGTASMVMMLTWNGIWVAMYGTQLKYMQSDSGS